MFKNCRTFWENFTGGDKYISQAKKLEEIYSKTWKELQRPVQKPSSKSKKSSPVIKPLKARVEKHISESISERNVKPTLKQQIVYSVLADPPKPKKRMTNNSQQSFFDDSEPEIIELDDDDEDPLIISNCEKRDLNDNDIEFQNEENTFTQDFEVPEFMSLIEIDTEDKMDVPKTKPGPASYKRKKRRKYLGLTSKKKKKGNKSVRPVENDLVVEEDINDDNFFTSSELADLTSINSCHKNEDDEIETISFSKYDEPDFNEENYEYSDDENISSEFIGNDSAINLKSNNIVADDEIDIAHFSSLPLDSHI